MALGQNVSSGASTTAALFHFDGGATDSSGNSNDGTVTNGSFVPGRTGSSCLHLTGTGYSESPDSASLDTSSVWISYWIRPASVLGTVVAKGYESPQQLNYGSYYVTGNVVNIRSAWDSGRSHTTPLGSVPIGVWTKIDLAVSNGDTVPKMWVNGSPVTPVLEDGSGSTYVLNPNSNALRIGSLTDGSLKLDGDVDELNVRKFIPTDSEVKKQYTNSLGRFATL